MGTPSTDPAFATYAIGSLPRPQWVREVIEDRKLGRIDAAAAGELLDAAIPSAMRLQERAGMDYVSDGEWRRESYIKVFSEHVDGFRVESMPVILKGASPDPAVVAPLEPRGPLAAEAARFLRTNARRKTIVALPSPYILGWRLWNPELSRDAYPTREEFMAACVPILRAELRELASAGVDHVQLDEPWLLMSVDPHHRERFGMAAVEREAETCVRFVNDVLSPDPGLPVSLHLCHGHFQRRRASEGGYEPIIEALGELAVDRLAMEFAAPQSQGIGSLARFPQDKVLGLGVIDHCDPQVEHPDTVVARVEAALEFVPAERITLNADCGFAPGMQNAMDVDEAYVKLASMCRAAEILRERYA